MIRRLIGGVTRWVDEHWIELFVFMSCALLLLMVFWTRIVYTIPSGSVGVMWYRFAGGTATDPDKLLSEGLQLIFPWDRIYIYDARMSRITDKVTGLSVDGLDVTVNVTSRFALKRESAGYLHKAIGPTYRETLVAPLIRTMVLSYISENKAETLYSSRRIEVQADIRNEVGDRLSNVSTNLDFDENYIQLHDVLVEEIILPPFVRRAIQQKEQVRQLSEAYDFRLELEQKESQRKQIEAEGIARFQETVAPGITESYLRWRGIEATLQLARSNNAKTVVIGGGKLPLILNTDPIPSGAGPAVNTTAVPPYAPGRGPNAADASGAETLGQLPAGPALIDSTLTGPGPTTAGPAEPASGILPPDLASDRVSEQARSLEEVIERLSADWQSLGSGVEEWINEGARPTTAPPPPEQRQ